MLSKAKIMPAFLEPLFWSYDFSKINTEKDKKRIIINTINYGNWQHWQWLMNNYGRQEVKRNIENIPKSEFRNRALKLICLLLKIKKFKYASRSDYIKAKKNI